MTYQLYHGDCLEIMSQLESQSVDAVICDPPYGTTACKWDSVIPFEPMWVQIKRVLKPRGACVLFGSQPFTSALVMSNVEMFKYEWIWEKGNGTNFALTGWQPFRCHEAILVFGDGKPRYYSQKTSAPNNRVRTIRQKRENPNGAYGVVQCVPYREYDQTRHPRSVQRFSVDKRSNQFVRQATIHPTQKPLALLEYLVKTYTNEGDTVLDFTMGSGTTGAACGNLGRRFVGIEKDDQYYAIAAERIATAYEPLRAMQGVA